MKRTGEAQSRKAEDVQNNEESERENAMPKALLNDVVLENIFKYLGFKDLKSCRQVGNITWLKNSSKDWWARSKVTISKMKRGGHRAMANYLNQNEINSSAKNYKLVFFCNGGYNGLWDRFGDTMKYLELANCSFTLDDFRNIIYTQCPNLEKIVADNVTIIMSSNALVFEPMKWQKPQFGEQRNLKFLRIHSSSSGELIPWMELLSHFPNIEALETDTERDICKMISIIRKQDPKMLKLNHITIRALEGRKYNESIRQILLDPELSFKVFGINPQSCHSQTLVDILSLHAKTLKELHFYGNTIFGSSIQGISWPPLHNLETLRIVYCRFTPEIFKYTPNVQKVQLIFPGTQYLLENFGSNLKITTCKELELDICGRWKEISNSELANFLRMFPNVEMFETDGLNNSRFSVICERLTKLVSLVVRAECEVDTCGLLGYDPVSKTNDGIRNPNITHLRNLQSLSLCSKKENYAAGGTVRIELKNADVILKGLEGLNHLKKFELKNYVLKDEQV